MMITTTTLEASRGQQEESDRTFPLMLSNFLSLPANHIDPLPLSNVRRGQSDGGLSEEAQVNPVSQSDAIRLPSVGCSIGGGCGNGDGFMEPYSCLPHWMLVFAGRRRSSSSR